MRKHGLFIFVLGLLVFSTTATFGGQTDSTGTSVNTFIGAADQSGFYYEERIWSHISPEGYLSGNAELVGNEIKYGDVDLSQVIPGDVLDIFRWGSVWTHQANSPFDRNLYLEFDFETNNARDAENAANTLLLLLGTQVVFEQLEFEGSEGFDWYDGDDWKPYTKVRYNGHVDWTSFKDVVDASVPREYGGLAATIDVYPATDLNFHFWTDGQGVTVAIGLHYQLAFINQVGGHTLGLKQLIPVDSFTPSPQSGQPLYIHMRLPDVDNLMYSLGNSSDTTTKIHYHPSPETHNRHDAYSIDSWIEQGGSYSDVTVSFDYEFTQWSWMNRERLDWHVGPRGYSDIHLNVHGKDRAAPSASLLANATLLDGVAAVWLDVDVTVYDVDNGYHHTTWLNVYFPMGYDETTANASAFAVRDELVSLGLHFNHSSDGNHDRVRYYNNTEIDAFGYHFAGHTSEAQLHSFIANSLAYDHSAAMQATTLANIQRYNWGMAWDRFGKASGVSIGVDALARGLTQPLGFAPFTQETEQSYTVDLFDPVYFGWGGDIPWNDESEILEINFNAPFRGEFRDIDFEPETNNGFGWDSGRHIKHEGSVQYFNYHLNVYSDDPRLQSQNDQGQWLDNGPFPGASVTFTNFFYTLDDDLEPPHLEGLWYDDPSGTNHNQLSDYPTYNWVDDSTTVSGNFALVTVVNDQYWKNHWNGNEWVNWFTSSGIDSITGLMYRSDAPIDHELFTKSVSFFHNPGWSENSNDRQAWEASFDTMDLPDGEWNLEAEVKDNDGNEGRSYGGSITIDNYDSSYQPAEIEFDTGVPENNDVVSDRVYFNFTVTDDAGIYVVIAWNNLGGFIQEADSSATPIGGGEQNHYTFMVDTLVQNLNGPMAITIEVLDMDGHWTRETINVVVDNGDIDTDTIDPDRTASVPELGLPLPGITLYLSAFFAAAIIIKKRRN